MRFAHLFLIPTLVTAGAMAGCNHDNSRSEYPDKTEQTKAQADAIRLERERRDQVIDRDLQQNKTALAFEESQVENKAKLERERITIERDQLVQPLKSRQDDARETSKRECDRIVQDSDAKLATLNGEEATRVKADTDSKIAEVKRKAADQVANAETDITAANQAAAKRIANVDAGEAKEKSAIGLRRDQAERQAREEHLTVASNTTTQLDKIAHQSQQRTDKEREVEAVTNQRDLEIATAVRQNIASHGDPARGVTVVSDKGVVVLSGAVPDETTRHAIVSGASKISGVVRVEDHLAIH
jgi:osmotically-inducible protein OsmY